VTLLVGTSATDFEPFALGEGIMDERAVGDWLADILRIDYCVANQQIAITRCIGAKRM
jgi:hypothetical protein